MNTARFLKTDNTTLGVTNLAGAPNPAQTTGDFIFGTADGSATGEAGLKVVVVGGSGTSGGGTVTAHTVLQGASSTQVIPIGAKGWTVSIITGTASIGAATGLPAGFSDADTNTLAATISVVTSSASSAYVRWNT